MLIFISVTAAVMWAAFWGVIRLERSMGQAPHPDRDTTARAPTLRHSSLRIRPPSGHHPGMCRAAPGMTVTGIQPATGQPPGGHGDGRLGRQIPGPPPTLNEI